MSYALQPKSYALLSYGKKGFLGGININAKEDLNSACITHIDSLFEPFLDRINKDIAQLSIPC